MDDFRAAKDALAARFLVLRARVPRAPRLAPRANVQGVGIGEQVVGGRPTGDLAVKILVRRKAPRAELMAREVLPTTIDGLPVDVEEVGLLVAFRAAAAPALAPAAAPNPRKRLRPARPGCSIGFEDPTGQTVNAGTFGAMVMDQTDFYVLSNNHVIAGENALPVGTPIFQPGLLDGGVSPADEIAQLSHFIPLRPNQPNTVDCAIAVVTDPNITRPAILKIGMPLGTKAAAIDMVVEKFGRTTGYTTGRVTGIAFDVKVNYPTLGTIMFTDQITVEGLNNKPFSDSGDSGSLIVERQTKLAVGLLFGGSGALTLGNHIDEVLQALNVELDP
ncbi:S1 family peptidase [Actinoplanes sp. L3-i22]|uniref:S1 family peptidase n=1 Tax=Actinoplanes sp. L3-i22 TaxID=2836373 RepID=UPI001C85629A|nr:S1 family peptidase [Actinoplanes sp. L3-i22]